MSMGNLGILIALSMSITATAAERPLCKGNRKLAKAAIESAANNLLGGPCQVTKVKKYMSWPSEGLEGYSAAVRCPGEPVRSFSSSIKKENGACRIRWTKMSPLTGAQCGLSDSWGGDEGETEWQFHSSTDLSKLKAANVSEIMKQQLIAVTDGEAKTAAEAIQFIVSGSEAEEAYYHVFSVNGKTFETIESFPGGNASGLIFPQGSATPIANNGDGEINCIE